MIRSNLVLKKCPFCGGEAKFFTRTFSQKDVSRGWQFGVFCTKCDVQTARTNYKVEITFESNGEITLTTDERQLAADIWNRRVEL